MKKFGKFGIGVLGAIFILVGGMDGYLGAMMPHDRYLVWIGIAMLAITMPLLVIAGVKYFRQKSQQKLHNIYGTLVIIASAIVFGAADACAETIHAGVLTPPATTPIQQWNPTAVLGPEFWAIGVVVTVALAIIYLHFFKRYFD